MPEMTTRYAIIENEEFACRHLQSVVASLRPTYELVFTSATVEDSMALMDKAVSLDLVFMDIELDDGDCFEIFRRSDLQVPVIFTTAYDQYAVRAFKVDSIDYLLKPIQTRDVADALARFEQRRRATETTAPHRTRTRFLVGNGNEYAFVGIDDIAWLEVEDKYVSIILKSGKCLLTDLPSLDITARELDPDRFFRISRSIVASIESITKVVKHFKGRLQIELRAGDRTRRETITAPRRQGFLSWLGQM